MIRLLLPVPRWARAASFALLTLAAANAQSLLQKAPPKAAARRGPYSTNVDAARAGSKLFARHCAACHGADRQGTGNSPPLPPALIRQAGDGAVFWVLTHGSRRHGMPSFAHLPEPQRWQITAFLRE